MELSSYLFSFNINPCVTKEKDIVRTIDNVDEILINYKLDDYLIDKTIDKTITIKIGFLISFIDIPVQ